MPSSQPSPFQPSSSQSSASPKNVRSLPTLASSPVGIGDAACCESARWLRRGAIGTAIATAILVAFLAGRNSESATPRESQTIPAWQVADLPRIDATASVSSDDYSIATGPVSERAEALFVLDHNSGMLQCNVIYPRVGQFMGNFTTNISEAMGTGGKGGKYIMTTGTANFQGAANQALAPCVLYVLDTSTGNYACFAVPFNRVLQNARKPQQGQIILLATGMANAVPDRDRLR